MKNGKIVIFIFALFLVLSLIIGLIVLASNYRKLDNQNKIIYEELSRMSDTQNLLINNFRVLESDSLQTRTLLGLPPVAYSMPDEERSDESQESVAGEGESSLQYFKGLELLLLKEKDAKDFNKVLEYLDSKEFKIVLENLGLTFDRNPGLGSIKRRSTTLYSLERDMNQYVIKSKFSGESLIIPATLEKTGEYFESSLKEIETTLQKTSAYTSQFLDLFSSQELLALVKNKNLQIRWKSPGSPAVEITDSEKTILRAEYQTEVQIFVLNQEVYKEFLSFKEKVFLYLESYDNRPEGIILFEKSKKEIKDLSRDPAFLSLLKKENLFLSTEPREDLDYFYYDIVNTNQERVGSFGLHKYQGIVYVMDKDDVPVQSLRSIGNRIDVQTKTRRIVLPSQEEISQPVELPKDTETILLCGVHETDTDTIMLAHCDSKSRKITLISVPRDIFYHGRKINTLYSRLGAEGLVAEIGKITGLNITKYIIIDMYAFIDVINILGGVEVTLQEDLIDPTYRVKQDGQWSTLYYKKGTYTLNGIEALRLARSRNFSSDFERAHRQHSILLSAKDKIFSLGIKDIGRLYQLLGVLIKYVETNFTVTDIATRILTYKDATFSGNNVLDSTNVLYSTYSNLYLLPEEEQEKLKEQEDFYRGAWILLPVENNFSFIPWYIKSIIEGNNIELQ